MKLMIGINGSGGSNDFGNEVLFVRLAANWDIGLLKDCLEVRDLESFPDEDVRMRDRKK